MRRSGLLKHVVVTLAMVALAASSGVLVTGAAASAAPAPPIPPRPTPDPFNVQVSCQLDGFGNQQLGLIGGTLSGCTPVSSTGGSATLTGELKTVGWDVTFSWAVTPESTTSTSTRALLTFSQGTFSCPGLEYAAAGSGSVTSTSNPFIPNGARVRIDMCVQSSFDGFSTFTGSLTISWRIRPFLASS
jgi:hypothetical protein